MMFKQIIVTENTVMKYGKYILKYLKKKNNK